MSHRTYIERLLITIGIVGLAALLWLLSGLLLLVFGAVLVGVILTSVAHAITSLTGLPHRWALTAAALGLTGLLIGGTALFGAELVAQAQQLGDSLPRAWDAVLGYANQWGLAEQLQGALSQFGGSERIAQQLGATAMALGSGLTNAFLIIVGGIYFAAQPKLYRTGIIKLIPEDGRGLIATALDDSHRALRLWLMGQLVSMTIVGVLTTLGLMLLGVPSALALGIVAGLLEFIPYAGPLLAAIPALLLALTVSPELALWTLLLYWGLQQIEGNLVQPLVQQRAVDLPPALLLFTIIAGTLLFGTLGIVFAAPLTVVIFVLVKRLYVREALHTKTALPGDTG